MDLNIAITYYSNLVDDCRRKASPERNDYMDLKDLAAEHAQLVDWLNELKILREKVRTLLEKQEQDGWIPITERMPEENDFVLVTVSGEDVRGCEWKDSMAIAVWTNQWNLVDANLVSYSISAWRPLPEPYTEDKA